MPETVQSVVRCPTNGPLLAAAAQLWIAPEDLVVDVAYGRGKFWTQYRPDRLVAHDLALDSVDFRSPPPGTRPASPQLPVRLRCLGPGVISAMSGWFRHAVARDQSVAGGNGKSR